MFFANAITLPGLLDCLIVGPHSQPAVCEIRNRRIPLLGEIGNLSYGNPLFDVAFVYYLAEFMPDDVVPSIFHFDMPTLKKCWALYAKEFILSE